MLRKIRAILGKEFFPRKEGSLESYLEHKVYSLNLFGSENSKFQQQSTVFH